MATKQKMIPLRLEAPTRERLDRLARQLDRPRSRLLREAIDLLLARYSRKEA